MEEKWIDAAFTSSAILKKNGEQDENAEKDKESDADSKKGMYEFKGKDELPQRLHLLISTFF